MALIKDITNQCETNEYFRSVLATGPHCQVVIMSIPAGGDIGQEIHADNDQVLYLLSGQGEVILGNQTTDFNPGDMVLVPAGTSHNFKTVGQADMKIITIYSPAHHAEGTIHKTKAEAEAAE